MDKKKDDLDLIREQNYSVNADFARARKVNNGQEVVDYQGGNPYRIWLNDIPVKFEAHRHSALEIIVPTENIYTAIFGRSTYEIQPEQIMFIPPGVTHELIAPQTGKRYIYLMNVSHFTSMRSFARIMSILSQPLLITREDNEAAYDQIYDLLMQMSAEYFNASEYSDLSIPALLLQLFICLGKNYADQINASSLNLSTRSKEYLDLFTNTLKYIDEHFTEKLSLEDMAIKTGFSKFHFSRLFKKYTNYNFSDYLCLRRVREAETLLQRPDIPITDVAITSGFSSISTFNRIFKQQTGCSPSEYRSLNSSMLHHLEITP